MKSRQLYDMIVRNVVPTSENSHCISSKVLAMIPIIFVKLQIKYRLLFVAKVLDFVSRYHNYSYQHLE